MKKYEVSEGFIKEAYEAAGAAYDGWKERIKKEFPEVFNVEFEVGKWYKNLTWEGSYMLYNGKGKGTSFNCIGVTKKGLWLDDGNWGKNESYRLATPEEVKAMLLKEAEKRGYKEGVKVKDAKYHDEYIIRNGVFFYECNGEYSLIDKSSEAGSYIFGQGKWAEIINESNEILERIESLQKELEELKERVK